MTRAALDRDVMRIRLKLMGMLKARTPEGGVLEIADGATVGDALDALGLAPQATHVVTVTVRSNATAAARSRPTTS